MYDNSLLYGVYVIHSIYFEDYLNELGIKYENAYQNENREKLTKLMNEKFKALSFEVQTDGEY